MRILKVDELYHWWDSTYKLHVDGFHEARLRSDGVRLRVGDVKALVNLAKKMPKAYYTQIAYASYSLKQCTILYTSPPQCTAEWR